MDQHGQRSNAIDLLKCLGILFVVFYHCHIVIGDILYHEGKFLPRNLPYYAVNSLISTCVPLFFFSTGFLLFSRALNLRRHINKTFRFLALFLGWASFTLLILIPVHKLHFTPFSFLHALLHLESGWLNEYWYLCAMIVLFCFFPLLKAAYDTRQDAFLFFLIVCLVFAFGKHVLNMGINVGTFLLRGKNPGYDGDTLRLINPLQGISYGYAFAYLGLGGFCAKHQKELARRLRPAVCIGLICLSVLLLTAYGVFMSVTLGKTWDNVFSGYSSPFTMANVLLLYLLSTWYTAHGLIGSTVRLISKNTLGIYLIHNIIRAYTLRVASQIPVFSDFMANLLYAVIIFLTSLLLTLLLRKIPGIRGAVSS